MKMNPAWPRSSQVPEQTPLAAGVELGRGDREAGTFALARVPIVGDVRVPTAQMALVAAHLAAVLEAQVVHAHSGSGRGRVGPDDLVERGREPPDRIGGSQRVAVDPSRSATAACSRVPHHPK
jgi:hypothetical protein